MRNKTSKGGIHLNDKGCAVFIRFLRSSFVKRKQRVFSRNSGRQAEFAQNPQDMQFPYLQTFQPPYTQGRQQTPAGPFIPAPVPRSAASYMFQSDSRDQGQGLVDDIAARVMDLMYRYYPPVPQWPVKPRG